MPIETQKFVRKPLYVDAIRITTTNFDEIKEWCQGEVKYETQVSEESSRTLGKKYIKVRVHNPKTPRQTMAFVGDWLLYTERGYKVYTNKAFHASFDKISLNLENSELSVLESNHTENNFPLFYIDPETGFLTDDPPHEGATALSFEELMAIIKKEIYSERHYARIEAACQGKTLIDSPSTVPEPREIVKTSAPVLTETEHTPKDKYILSRQEQQKMTADEIRDLVQSGDVLLEQDIEQS